MKIAMDTAYAGRVFLCLNKKYRFLWSHLSQPLEVLGHDDAVIAAKLGKFCRVKFVDFAGTAEETVIVSFEDDGDEVVGGYVGFINTVVELLGGDDLVNKKLDAISSNEYFARFRAAGNLKLREQVAASGDAHSLKVKLRDAGDGVRLVAELENAVPLSADGASGEGVNFAQAGVVKPDSVDKTKGEKASGSACGIAVGGATNDSVKLTFRVQDGKTSGVAGVGVVALVIYRGQYFAVDGEGVHSLNDLGEHVGSGDGENAHSANSQALGYFVKYVAKGI